MVTVVAVGVIYAVALGGLVWIARRVRRSGVRAQVLGVFDELYHPEAHRMSIEILAQADQGEDVESPDRPGRR